MNITKIETNYKRNLLFNKTKNIKTKKYTVKLEEKIINIYPDIEYQTLIGFGGTFTESTGIAIKSLSKEKQEEIIKEYFSENGLGYNFCRLCIGSSDFSESSYSYSKKEDLSDFSIKKDKKYIIDIVKQAQNINPDIQFLSSPWSPPRFMKTNKRLILGGRLQEKYKKLWAEYLVKYIREYKKEGIEIKYMTIQNEPNAIQLWESCTYTPEEESDLAVNYIFPIFKENRIRTKILIWDHNKEKLYTRAMQEINTEKAVEAIAGIAFHWYSGDHFENIKLLKEKFPDKLLIHTEGCIEYSKFKNENQILNAEKYAHDILGDLNSGANGYIDWNMVLNHKGGPNHKKNYCDSPVMINKGKDNYIKNLSYYYIGHFSKYIKPGAKKIAFSKYTDDIEVTAFKNQDNSVIVILLNKTDFDKEYNICIAENIVIQDKIIKHSILTYVIN